MPQRITTQLPVTALIPVPVTSLLSPIQAAAYPQLAAATAAMDASANALALSGYTPVPIVTSGDVCSRVTVSQSTGQRVRFQVVDGAKTVNVPAGGTYTFFSTGSFAPGTQVGTIGLIDNPGDPAYRPAPLFLIEQLP